MAKHRIKVTGKPKRTIDLDLLAEAIVQTVERKIARSNEQRPAGSDPGEVAS